jgi:FKBP-type peptidyl-prolyl cis-trans isomerase
MSLRPQADRSIAIVVLSVAMLLTAACGSAAPPQTAATGAPSAPTEVTLADGLKYTDEQVGTGAEAQPGKTAVVLYTG